MRSLLPDFDELRSIATDECVEWPYSCYKNGYGQIRYGGRRHGTHRLALVLATGVDRVDLVAAHGPCHNRRCMNVRHLYWTTAAQNQNDRVRDGTDFRGTRSPLSRLTESEAREILRSLGTQQDIADRFGVSRSLVSSIRRGKRWAHLKVTPIVEAPE